MTARHDYHPFGEEIGALAVVPGSPQPRTATLGYTTDTVRKQFTGYERDTETDLDFAKARMFGYLHGRFTSPDPLMASAKRMVPQSWNRYTYVLNNPLRFVDPTGMVWGERRVGDTTYYCYAPGRAVCKGYTKYTGDGILTNPSINGRELGYAIRLLPNGGFERVVPIDVPGQGRSWLNPNDAEAINAITGGVLCSISAGFACPNKGEKIADNVTAAADVIQYAFLVKTLLKAGVSLAAIAAVIKKNPDDVSKLATKVIGEGCYQTGDCKVAAVALLKEFEKNGVKGTLVRLKTPNGEAIFRNGKQIAEEYSEGHFGIQVGDFVYEMNSTKGIPVGQWAKGYEFRVTGTHTIKNPILEVVSPE